METPTLEHEQVVTLGEVRFRPTPEDEMVFEQYAYAQKAATDAGLGQELMDAFRPFVDELLGEREELTEEQLYQVSEKVMMRAFEGRAYLRLLAAVLVREGEEWTLDRAQQNEQFFSRLKGKDIRKMHQILLIATMGFFTSGLRSIATSQKSSRRRKGLEDLHVRLRDVDVTESPMEEMTTTTAGDSATESSER